MSVTSGLRWLCFLNIRLGLQQRQLYHGLDDRERKGSLSAPKIWEVFLTMGLFWYLQFKLICDRIHLSIYFLTVNDGWLNHTHKVRFRNRLFSTFSYFSFVIYSWGVCLSFPEHKMWLYFSTSAFSFSIWASCYNFSPAPFNLYILQDRVCPIAWTHSTFTQWNFKIWNYCQGLY